MKRLNLLMVGSVIGAVLTALVPGCGGEGSLASHASGAAGASGAGAAGNGGSAGSGGSAGVGGTAGTAGSAGSSGASGSGGSSDDAAWQRCQASEQAFVRKAYFAVLGRRPSSQAEVDVFVDLIASIDKLDGFDPSAPVHAGANLRHARRVAVEAMMNRDDYVLRWVDALRDILRVQRSEEQANVGCYGTSQRLDGDVVAKMIRDHKADDGGDGSPFTMRDVIVSSIKLDDPTPAYTANLFGMLTLSYPGANVDPDKLELARRADFGAWFDGVYLHRDGVCLACHNTESSMTFDPDPAKNRHFPMPGKLEKALFGASTGVAPDDAHDGIARSHGMLRFDGFSNMGGATPWGWNPACGQYPTRDQVPPDVASVDTRFGHLSGDRVSAWNLAESLQSGFAKLREHGLSRGPDGEIPDPDEAFAYLVAANLVEKVWKETVGSPLTIANYFPRNQASRDVLLTLTESFVGSGFSLRHLIVSIVQHPLFNLLAPDAGCGDSPFEIPNLFDPWTTADEDPTRRRNGSADGVFPITSRTLMRMTYRALEWPEPEEIAFPFRDGEEGEFQAEIGVFLKNSEPGFRGFDFQARLSWESRMGKCTKPAASVDPDLVDRILTQASTTPGAKVRDVIEALKDRLINEPTVDTMSEQPALEAILGTQLDAPATSIDSAAVRTVCGVLLASPQYLLGGLAPLDGSTTPLLTPSGSTYGDVCTGLATQGLSDGLLLSCNGKATVTKPQ